MGLVVVLLLLLRVLLLRALLLALLAGFELCLVEGTAWFKEQLRLGLCSSSSTCLRC